MRPFLDMFIRWQGRIKRSQFWLAIFMLAIVHIALATAASLLGFGEKHTGTVVTTLDGATQQTSFLTTWTLAPWATFVVSLLILPLAVVVLRKRRHDRGKSGVDSTLILVAGIVLQLFAASRIGGSLVDLLSLVYAVGITYLLVVAGILPGTPGPNRYGVQQ